MDIDTCIKTGDKLFEKRFPMLSLWQEIADNFYPERADFTASRSLGDEFADNLMTSYPLIARRDLGNSFASMLRPTSKQWFKISTTSEEEHDNTSDRWLEMATKRQFQAMYDRQSQFTRATKEGDHDFAAFGQAVISIEPSKDLTRLLYRCWHLRDVTWSEGWDGQINSIHRKWNPCAIDLIKQFPKSCHKNVHKIAEKEPFRPIKCRHVVKEAEPSKESNGLPFMSYYIDVENKHEMEAVGSHSLKYVIPRWQTVSGSQYAYSPATIAALPDARLIQAMTLVLLEAGEKATNPPMVAVQNAIRGDIATYAGGVTWADAAYDERLGEVLRPMTSDKSGIPIGMELQSQIREMISEAFYLNKLTLPPQGDMTAFEVSQRIQEFIRQAMPIFEPMEHEYNGALCEETFELMMRLGAFGSYRDIPQNIRGKDIKFKFESPLHDAIERNKVNQFVESANMLATAAQIDPMAQVDIDVREAYRDVLKAIGTPAKWRRDPEQAAEIEAQMQQAQQAQEMMMAAQAGAETAETAGRAAQEVAAGEQAVANG